LVSRRPTSLFHGDGGLLRQRLSHRFQPNGIPGDDGVGSVCRGGYIPGCIGAHPIDLLHQTVRQEYRLVDQQADMKEALPLKRMEIGPLRVKDN
jgi:hypothetical protein